MPEKNEKTFDLGCVLTITSGRLFTELDNLYAILEFLFNDEIHTVQIPKMLPTAQIYVLSKYPQLKGVGQDAVINDFDDVKNFLNSKKDALGDSFTLTPIPKPLCEQIDSINEVVEMRSSKTI